MDGEKITAWINRQTRVKRAGLQALAKLTKSALFGDLIRPQRAHQLVEYAVDVFVAVGAAV